MKTISSQPPAGQNSPRQTTTGQTITGQTTGGSSGNPGPGIQRKELLGFLFFGHFVIHWFQQMLPMFVPMLKADLGLTDIQVGGMTTAKQAASGVLTLPSGIMADAFVNMQERLAAA